MNRFYIITNCEQEEDFHHLSGFNFSEIIYSVRSHDLLVKILIGYDLYDKKKKATFFIGDFPFYLEKNDYGKKYQNQSVIIRTLIPIIIVPFHFLISDHITKWVICNWPTEFIIPDNINA